VACSTPGSYYRANCQSDEDYHAEVLRRIFFPLAPVISPPNRPNHAHQSNIQPYKNVKN